MCTHNKGLEYVIPFDKGNNIKGNGVRNQYAHFDAVVCISTPITLHCPLQTYRFILSLPATTHTQSFLAERFFVAAAARAPDLVKPSHSTRFASFRRCLQM